MSKQQTVDFSFLPAPTHFFFCVHLNTLNCAITSNTIWQCFVMLHLIHSLLAMAHSKLIKICATILFFHCFVGEANFFCGQSVENGWRYFDRPHRILWGCRTNLANFSDILRWFGRDTFFLSFHLHILRWYISPLCAAKCFSFGQIADEIWVTNGLKHV